MAGESLPGGPQTTRTLYKAVNVKPEWDGDPKMLGDIYQRELQTE